ncbi:MAG TPA: hypothetical protein VK670_08795 [Silvibacterium sp.]|nr:hypothetical protein [Silvibacterium sp.]
MPSKPLTTPVQDTVSKLDNQVAIGEDLGFQRKWWKFERAAWVMLALILLLDITGAFGRGPIAKARTRAPDGSMLIDYERLERIGTPSMVTITFAESAMKSGTVTLYVTDGLVQKLGAQRVIPQPETTVLGHGGLTYTFSASGMPGSIEFDLQPTSVGPHNLVVQVVGAAPVTLNIFVFP